jgi:urease accessory protein
MQLADSAAPIGSAAHSFGLESLIADGLEAGDLRDFFQEYLLEGGVVDAVFCREGFSAGRADAVQDLTSTLSALRPARESRMASLTLGRRLLRLAFDVSGAEELNSSEDIHLSIAFGLAGCALGMEWGPTAAACLQQSMGGMISACQRLLPLGQVRAARILWDLKPAMIEAVEIASSIQVQDVCCFQPQFDVASMMHTRLPTRLFIS